MLYKKNQFWSKFVSLLLIIVFSILEIFIMVGNYLFNDVNNNFVFSSVFEIYDLICGGAIYDEGRFNGSKISKSFIFRIFFYVPTLIRKIRIFHQNYYRIFGFDIICKKSICTSIMDNYFSA